MCLRKAFPSPFPSDAPSMAYVGEQLELQNDLFFLSWFSEEVEVWILINGVFEVDVSVASFSTFEDFYALLVVF